MMNVSMESLIDRWPLERILLLVLAGGFAGLMVDIRVEHVEAVREHGVAWIPIIYAGLMAVACGVAFFIWNRGIRITLLMLFAAAFAIGGVGFYFHNRGKIRSVIATSISAWTDPTQTHLDGPPPTAPLAFAGLGMIGILTSVARRK